MAGNKEGGLQAARTNKERYGKDYYAIVGAIGGKSSRTGGFHANRDLAREAGRLGGRISKRGQKFVGFVEGIPQYVEDR